jgi:iron complex outermembrane receptor protein
MRNVYSVFLLWITIYFIPIYSQSSYSFRGQVVDEQGKPLAGAYLFLSPTDKKTTTDDNGSFAFNGLPKGQFTLTITFIGYKQVIDTIIIEGNTMRTYQLSPSSQALHEVVIKGSSSQLKSIKETPLNISIVNETYLRQNLGGSLMQTLERLPGVSAISIGSGQSKPVIRGLGFNRVVVAENNIKHEGQQWATEHGIEIDQYAIDHIEIIKGPASLTYGSDAIGGIIDISNKNITPENTFGGSITLTGKTNNNLVGGSLNIFARKKRFYTNFRLTQLYFGDYKVPADSIDIYSYRAPLHHNALRNTAGKEHNFQGTIGIIQENFQSQLLISSYYQKAGFFANAHGLEPRKVNVTLHDKSDRDIQLPFDKVSHIKIINNSTYRYKKWKITTDLAFQQNFRQEWSQYVQHGYMPPVFPDTLSFDPNLERQFDKHVYTGNIRFLYNLTEETTINYGINHEFQTNRIDGRNFIIPSYRQWQTGSYITAKHHISEQSLIQTGVRFDYGKIKIAEYFDWYPSPVVQNSDTTLQYLKRALSARRNFSNVTWSVGYNYNNGNWTCKVNLGKSFRIPLAQELAANGINYHRFSYEIGNINLLPEVSYQLDAGVEYNSEEFYIEITPFVNYFSNYIYLNPTLEYDQFFGGGNQIFKYTQCKVFRYGSEVQMNYTISRSLQFGMSGEYVYSIQLSGEKKGFTLPFAPPASAIFNLKYQSSKIGFITNSYLSVDYKITATQHNIVPPEKPTIGYRIVNIGFGGVFVLYSQNINFNMQIQNLLNKKYFKHTSYYRIINVPEPGRNFILNLTIPFSGQFKQ